MISAQFANLLASGRPEFNRRVAEARRRYPAFDVNAFGAFLSTSAAAVADVAALQAPERAGAIVMAAYDVALELVAHGQAGSVVEQVWRQLVPCHAALLGEQPAAVLGMLTNAALHLEKSRPARLPEWLALMAALAPQVADLRQLSTVGQICAWRAGMAHFRHGAITAADTLPEPLALAAFAGGASGAAPSWATLREALQADLWWTPDAAARERLATGIEIGAFTGFGGAFAQPPEVRPAADGFWVRSGARYSLLLADACGAMLHGAAEEEYAQAQAPTTDARISLSGQRLTIIDRAIMLDLPAEQLRVVCNAHSVAVTSPYSHAIRVLPLS